MQLRGHLGARKPPKTILFVTLDNLGVRIPLKTLLFLAPDSLGRQNSSENTAVCCCGAPWARTTAQPLNDRKSFSATLYSVASQWAPSNTVHFMHGFTLVYNKISLRSWRVGDLGVSPGSLLRSHLDTGKTPKTQLFVAPEPLGYRKTFENTVICCPTATWAPQDLRKHRYLLLRSYLGTGIPPKTLLFVAPGGFN